MPQLAVTSAKILDTVYRWIPMALFLVKKNQMLIVGSWLCKDSNQYEACYSIYNTYSIYLY